MSAKSVQGPGGKKPASAATNLIGKVYNKNTRNMEFQRPSADMFVKLEVVPE
jgi:hypothetical protein